MTPSNPPTSVPWYRYRLRLEARPEQAPHWVWLAPLLATAMTMVAGAILFAALGKDPLVALFDFFIRPLDSLWGIGELGVKAAPLMLIAAGLTVGFRGGVWNIGAEGQLILGAVVGGSLALALSDWDSVFVLPAILIAGAIGGAAWSSIPAFLRTKFHANEILVSLMLTYVAVHLLGYLVHGPLRDPMGFNFPQSETFSSAASVPVILQGTRLHLGALVALAAIAGLWVLIGRSFIGFQIKVIGLAPQAGAYAGFSQNRIIWIGLLAGGVSAGLAGVLEVAGPIGQLQPVISPGYGFTAIIVAFLGRLHPVGIVFASLFMALSYLGGETVQMSLGLPLAVTGVFQGMILFFLLGTDVLVRYRPRLRAPAGMASSSPPSATIARPAQGGSA